MFYTFSDIFDYVIIVLVRKLGIVEKKSFKIKNYIDFLKEKS